MGIMEFKNLVSMCGYIDSYSPFQKMELKLLYPPPSKVGLNL